MTANTFSVIIDSSPDESVFVIDVKYLETIKDHLVKYELKSEGIDP